MGLDFVGVDFEIANRDPSSACAIGLAFVRDGQITASTSHLIRPPSRKFVFTRVHQLTWKDVCDAPTFADLWVDLGDRLRSEILVAHNAGFDRAVLCECLRHYGIRYRPNPFVCSMLLSQEAFAFDRVKLDYVCGQLNIALQHHNAESDAKAAANIVIKAAQRLGAASINQLLELCPTQTVVLGVRRSRKLIMPAPKNRTKRENINLPMPRHEDCWAKTTKDNRPGINVRDHCLNVGCVAEALLQLLPQQLRNLLPPGAATLASLHDIGKVSPGFQKKCSDWLVRYPLPHGIFEEDHAKVSQFTVGEMLGASRLHDWAAIVGAHHGKLKGALSPQPWEDERRRLAKELIAQFGPLPDQPAEDAVIWFTAGLITRS